MSKRVILTEEELAKVREIFDKFLANPVVEDGKLSIEQKFEDKRTAKLFFTSDAFVKMTSIVSEYSSEVAWHGLCKRHENEEDTYVIYDIMVYPQEVTGATVNTDQVPYQKWMDEQSDDVFNNIRFQGHSHVNMQTSPSSVDLGHQGAIIDNLNSDDFYVFVIWNKRGEHWTKIVDLKTNRCFTNSEISIDIVTTDGKSVKEFVCGTKALVQPKAYTSYSTSSYYGQKNTNPSFLEHKTKPSKIETTKQTVASPYGSYDDDDFDYTQYGGGYC